MEMVDSDNHKHSTSTIAFTANLENESASTDIAIRFTSRYVWRISKNAFFCSMFIIGVATTLLSVVNLLALIFIRSGHHYGENVFISSGGTNDHLPCGTWKAYSDLKCIKVIDQMETYDKAVELCKKADPSATLLVIHTKDEQAFMGKYLFVKERLFNSVWLGGRMKSIGGRATYADDNDLELVYTNWEKRHPKEGTGQICSQMQPDPDPDHNSNFMVDHGYRKWISVRCEAKGAVVCQRFQNWSPARFQTTMMRTLVEVERLRKALDDVIPEGFTYLQLPEEEPPNHLWPNLIFRDFTYQFPSGHFLRVINHTEGQAQEYFTLQLEDQMPESSPRLTEVRITTTTANSSTASSYLSSAKITPGEWSSVALTTMQSQPLSLNYSQYLVNNSSGQTNKMQQTNLQFLVEKAEVRPKSLAVKIWRRCKSKL